MVVLNRGPKEAALLYSNDVVKDTAKPQTLLYGYGHDP